MALILHRCHLYPFVFFNDIFLNRVQSLLSRESAKNEDITSHQSDGMCISTLVHWGAGKYVIFLSHINSGILLGRGTSTSYQDFYR